MSARVFGVQFSDDLDRVMNVRVSSPSEYIAPARSPQATDFPSDLVAAIRDWADAGLTGIHEDYRVPAQLVAYLNEVVSEGEESSRAVVASTVLRYLGLVAPKDGN